MDAVLGDDFLVWVASVALCDGWLPIDFRYAPFSTEVMWRCKMLRWAMCGRLQVGKKNHHVAALVGAAMCSAFLRGSQ
jgi:hypothetical protein